MKISRSSGRYCNNRYSGSQRFTEASVKKLTAKDFISQEEIDEAVREVLEMILMAFDNDCEYAEDEGDEDFDPKEAFEEAVAGHTNCDDFAGNSIADRLANEMDLEEKLTYKNYKQWCKLYDIDLSEYEYIR